MQANRLFSIGRNLLPGSLRSPGSQDSSASQSATSSQQGVSSSSVALALHNRPTLEQTAASAADTQLAKKSKLEAGFDGIVVAQLAQIAEDEILEVREWKKKHVFKDGNVPQYSASKDEDVASVQVFDDVTTNHNYHYPPPAPTPTPVTQGAGPLGIIGAILGGSIPAAAVAMYALSMNKPAAAPAVAPIAVEKKVYPLIEYQWRVQDGKKVQQYREDGGPWRPVPEGGISVSPKK